MYSEAKGAGDLVQNQLASFWKPALSKAFAGATHGSQQPATGKQRKGEKTAKEEMVNRAKAMREAGQSYGQIAKALGVSKSTAYELVNGD